MPQIPRIHQPSLGEFRDAFALPGKPVIITGATENWKARHWSLADFLQRFGQVQVEVTAKGAEIEGTRSTTLTEYVNALEQGMDKGDYLTSWCFRKDCPEILDDFEIPIYFREDWLEELPEQNDMMWLFLGAKGSGMGLHQDLGHTAAWNAQVTGLKSWALVSPAFSEFLYEGRVCCFKPNRVRYSKFRKAEVWLGEVQAGEILYIPGAWWHQTENLETGFSITANYVDDTNYKKVLDCLAQSEEKQLWHDFSEIVRRKEKLWK